MKKIGHGHMALGIAIGLVAIVGILYVNTKLKAAAPSLDVAIGKLNQGQDELKKGQKDLQYAVSDAGKASSALGMNSVVPPMTIYYDSTTRGTAASLRTNYLRMFSKTADIELKAVETADWDTNGRNDLIVMQSRYERCKPGDPACELRYGCHAELCRDGYATPADMIKVCHSCADCTDNLYN